PALHEAAGDRARGGAEVGSADRAPRAARGHHRRQERAAGVVAAALLPDVVLAPAVERARRGAAAEPVAEGQRGPRDRVAGVGRRVDIGGGVVAEHAVLAEAPAAAPALGARAAAVDRGGQVAPARVGVIDLDRIERAVAGLAVADLA